MSKKNLAKSGLVVTLVSLAWLNSSCGGGGGSVTTPSGGTTSTPPPTTAPPVAGQPHIVATASPMQGQQPLNVTFDLCKSTDGANGTSLEYSADFGRGQGLQQQSTCSFSHSFSSNGLNNDQVTLVVKDKNDSGQDKQTLGINTWANVQLSSLTKSDRCNKLITATATVEAGAGFRDIAAQAAVTDVMFQATNLAGTANIGPATAGDPSGVNKWSKTWNIGNTDKVRVCVTTTVGNLSHKYNCDPAPGC